MLDLVEKTQIRSEMANRKAILANEIQLNPITYNNYKTTSEITIPAKFYKNLTLDDKIIMAKAKIAEFIDRIEHQDGKDTKIMISYSGGKDSCVLQYLVHEVERERERDLIV
jgi:hypothetical protein